MFKRINKRIRKKEQEEEDGIDDELKQVIGAQDTDSDESDSSSEGSASEAQNLGKRTRGDSDESESEDEDPAPMTVAEALVNPLYPADGEANTCIVCPGKELKHAKMVSVHIASSTHTRRMKRFAALATRVGDEDDPRLLVAALDESTEPRLSKKDRRIAKRQRRQERKAAKTSDQTTNQTTSNLLQTKIEIKKAEPVKKHKLAKRQKTR